VFVFTIQALAGVLLLSGFFVPLALILLAAELYNILAYHLTLNPGFAPGIVACVLWVLVFDQYRTSFNTILSPKSYVARLNPAEMPRPMDMLGQLFIGFILARVGVIRSIEKVV
jgi:hypothetical protein